MVNSKRQLLVLLICAVISVPSSALNLNDHARLKSAVQPLITDGTYTVSQLNDIFRGVTLRKSVIKKKENSAERKLTWQGGYRKGGYKGIFIQQDRIEKGSQFWAKHSVTMQRAQEVFEVEPHIVSAIIGVETKFGAHKGKHKVLESIATFADRGSKLQYGQLPIFLRLVAKGDLDINVMGSYSGAMGVPQFISSSYRDFGVDFDKDGRVDLLGNEIDAIGSVANYFSEHGWKQAQPVMVKLDPLPGSLQTLKAQSVKRINSRSKPQTTLANLAPLLKKTPKHIALNEAVGVFEFDNEEGQAEYYIGLHNFYVIMRYNHSYLYARAVYELSNEILSAHNK